MRRGTTLSLPVEARNEDGSVIDLTGLTATAIAWRIGTDDRRATRITKTIGSGVTITDAAAGKFTLRLDPADTADLRPDLYAHAAEVTESGGDVTTVLRGCLDLKRDLP